MCLAIPACVVELLEDDEAIVDLDGVRKRISVAFLTGLAPGDYVILHAGFALSRLDTQEAEQTLDLIAQTNAAMERGR